MKFTPLACRRTRVSPIAGLGASESLQFERLGVVRVWTRIAFMVRHIATGSASSLIGLVRIC